MRVFVAVEISDNEVIKSIEKFQKTIQINARPVESKNFHFTLQFLGEISDKLVEKSLMPPFIQSNFQVLM